MEKAYIVPGWITVIAGFVIHRQNKVLFGLRSARQEAGKWCLPAGLGAIRRDISDVLAKSMPASLDNPMDLVQAMSVRHQKDLLSPAGFALAEAQWYVQIPPEINVDQLVPLNPVCRLDNQGLLVKLYFGLKWLNDDPPKPALTAWPFKEVRFLSQSDLSYIDIAFDNDKDMEEIFWL